MKKLRYTDCDNGWTTVVTLTRLEALTKIEGEMSLWRENWEGYSSSEDAINDFIKRYDAYWVDDGEN